MWINEDGLLRQTSDEMRVKFRTSLSIEIIDQLKKQAAQHGTFVNYLLEDGLKVLLDENFITFDKKTRPKDRVQYKTTYDAELLEMVRVFAKENQLYINDAIEYSVQFINVERAKKGAYRYRIE